MLLRDYLVGVHNEMHEHPRCIHEPTFLITDSRTLPSLLPSLKTLKHSDNSTHGKVQLIEMEQLPHLFAQ